MAGAAGPGLDQRVRRVVAALVVLASLAAPAAAGALTVHVSGNSLLDGSGQPIRLLGVNRSGAEYACIQGWGFFDGPVGAASIAAMQSWKINAVRVPLNEDCWLAINGAPAVYSGTHYRRAVEGYVSRLRAAGLVVVLDLHWNAPGRLKATGQRPMADADHSPAFWASVATAFKGTSGLVFDLYNEPHDITWRCWRDGCTLNGHRLAGMQRLVNAVRGAGGTQPLMLGGLGWANDLSRWLAWRPTDSRRQLIASLHVYDFTSCSTLACWQSPVGSVASRVPVVTGELGEADCGHSFIDSYMNWADTAGVSYLGWTWDTWDCSGGPALISSYDGTPTAFGVGFRDNLASLP